MPKSTDRLIVGNWKMHGFSAALAEISALATALAAGEPPRCIVVICPPATLLAEASRLGSMAGILTGGQDCHPALSGAHTGDLSAAMLKDAGASYVIVGHSERRADHGETSELVRAKAEAGLTAKLIPIVCVGETLAERDAGRAETIVLDQLDRSLPDDAAGRKVVVAYEPVWAIGTGRTPTDADIAAMHLAIRQYLVTRFGAAGQDLSILYGGSVKPANARTILAIANVDGALVGGASLLASDLTRIISAV
ncbi:MAG: triose-phosphate isomerase [Devosia sp.]|nr:triose-phosphate isomerase [Devosia sp.]